jgi:hypothetical protein
VSSDISEEVIAPIFRIENISEPEDGGDMFLYMYST